jgi:hypothetical protein
MPETGRLVQGLIIFSTLLGIAFLWEVYGLVPAAVFDFVTLGEVLFVIDSILTFIRPTVSYYFGAVLAALALASSLPQSVHYTLIQSGMVVQAATFIVGTVAQVLIIVLVLYQFVRSRRKDEWAWPGAESAA